jgi:putative membrane protein
MQKNSTAATAADAVGHLVGDRCRFSWLVLFVASTVCGLIAVAAQPSYAQQAGQSLGTAPRAVGAAVAGQDLLPADRDLLVKVRLAGLWEMPAGEMAARKGVNPRVRQIGKMISEQHGQLDALVVQAAKEVGVALPNEPNADQRKWLADMNGASGVQFDQVFVDRLRAAHGKVFPIIAAVRSGTRNAVVRRLAQRANGFVLTHLTLLESTGLVDYSELPPPPQSAAASPTALAAAAETQNTIATTTSLIRSQLWFASIAAATILLLFALIRWRSRRRRRQAWYGAQHRSRPSRTDTEPQGIRAAAPYEDVPVSRRSVDRIRH